MKVNMIISKAKSEVSLGGKLPMPIESDRVLTILEECLEEFYENDDRATLSHYMVADTSAFVNNRITLPKCVKAVMSAIRMEGQFVHGIGTGVDPDFRKMNNMMHDFYGGQTMMVQAVAAASINHFVGQMRLETVSFDYSEYNNVFVLKGKKPIAGMVLEVASTLEPEAMYQMKDFRNYFFGKLIEENHTLLTLTEAKLIGGYKVNLSGYLKKGEKFVEKAEKKWDEQKSEADFLLEF